MKDNIMYKVFIPGGNNTAFVMGTDYTLEQRSMINDRIMNADSSIEQVGFLGDNNNPELVMAGGEFCGNATRSAVFYYLDGQDGKMTLKVNQKDYIEAGVKDKMAWCEIPLIQNGNIVEKIQEGMYKVNMKGMTSIVISEEDAKKYLNKKENIKEETMMLIKKLNLENSEAVGVMYLESVDNKLKINPVVWVKEINTLFYETACGSGTTATAIVKSYLEGNDVSVDILQPSGYVINATITGIKENKLRAVISGVVLSDNVEHFC